MALEALENPWKAKPEGVADAIHALRQALAQQEQEPVAYVSDSGSIAVMVAGTDIEDDTPLYTAPPTMPDDLIATYEKGFRDGQAKHEQKPVAWMHELADGHRHCVTKDESGYVDNFTDTYKTIPLYTAPPHHVSDVKKREWVGLTEADIYELMDNEDEFEFAKAIEAKLKEKNGG